jgi:transposase-like protein
MKSRVKSGRFNSATKKKRGPASVLQRQIEQIGRIPRTKGGFPNENSLLKLLLYMGIQNACKKWTMPIRNWNLALSQLAIFFEGRLDDALEL